MPSSFLSFGPVGFAATRAASRRTWFALAMVAVMPAWAAARVVPDFLTIGSTAPLSDNAPNLWAIVAALPWIGELPLAGLTLAMATGAAAWLAAHFSARPPRREEVLPAALLIALALPALLPRMQPDDFLLAVMLASAVAIRQRRPGIGALVTAGYLLAIDGQAMGGAIPMIAATAIIARPFFTSPANDNGLPLNPYTPYPA